MKNMKIKKYIIVDKGLIFNNSNGYTANELISEVYNLIVQNKVGIITQAKDENCYVIPYNDKYIDDFSIIIENRCRKNKDYYNLYLNRLIKFSEYVNKSKRRDSKTYVKKYK